MIIATAEEYNDLVERTDTTPLRLEKRACVRCRTSRRACDGARPSCGRCKDLKCEYPEPSGRKRRRPPSAKKTDADSYSGSPSGVDSPYPEVAPTSLQIAVPPCVPEQLLLPPNLDDTMLMNGYIRTFLDVVLLRTIGPVIQPSSFLASLRGIPEVDRALLASVIWHGALASEADQTIMTVLRRRAWRTLLDLRNLFWSLEAPPCQMGASYLSSLVLCMYASWRTLGMGCAKRFHEELVNACFRLGIPSWGSMQITEAHLDTTDWIARQQCLQIWWNEAFAMDGTLAMGTGNDAILDSREFMSLPMAVDVDIFVSVDCDQPLPLSVLRLEKLFAADLLSWTMLPAGCESRKAMLQRLWDPAVLRDRYGYFWATAVTMILSQLVAECAKLRTWCVSCHLSHDLR